MEKPLIVYSDVPAFKEWPTNFKLLFQALHSSSVYLPSLLLSTLFAIHDICEYTKLVSHVSSALID